MEKLFTTYLFPELSEPTETKVIQSSIPVMHNTTRQEIYNILLLLCEDQANCERMLTLLDDVIPYGMGYLQIINAPALGYITTLLTSLQIIPTNQIGFSTDIKLSVLRKAMLV